MNRLSLLILLMFRRVRRTLFSLISLSLAYLGAVCPGSLGLPNEPHAHPTVAEVELPMLLRGVI